MTNRRLQPPPLLWLHRVVEFICRWHRFSFLRASESALFNQRDHTEISSFIFISFYYVTPVGPSLARQSTPHMCFNTIWFYSSIGRPLLILSLTQAFLLPCHPNSSLADDGPLKPGSAQGFFPWGSFSWPQWHLACSGGPDGCTQRLQTPLVVF